MPVSSLLPNAFHTLSERSCPAPTRDRINLIIACYNTGMRYFIHLSESPYFIVILLGYKTQISRSLGVIRLVSESEDVDVRVPRNLAALRTDFL